MTSETSTTPSDQPTRSRKNPLRTSSRTQPMTKMETKSEKELELKLTQPASRSEDEDMEHLDRNY